MEQPGGASGGGKDAKRPVPPYRLRRRWFVVAVCLAFAIGVVGAVADFSRMLGGPALPGIDIHGRPATPTFAFDLPAPGEPALQRPVSVTATGERIYVTDSLAGEIVVLRHNGSIDTTIGADHLGVPLYAAVDPEGDELYVSDRAFDAVLAFSTRGGSFIETITPSFEGTDTPVAWSPIAVEVAPDGSLFVSDVAGEHRVWHVARDGTVLGVLPDPDAAGTPVTFDFPNAVKALDGRVWVSDSNNRRLVEFDADGRLVRSLPLGRLIRGFDVVMAEEGAPVYFALTDAFSHQVVLVSEAGSEVARVGEPGVGPGQMSFPNDVAVHDGITWVVDTGNARVQAWEWSEAAHIAAAAVWPGGPGWVGLLSIPFLLAPLGLLALVRRVRAAVSPEAIPMLSVWGATGTWDRVLLLLAPSAGEPPHPDTLPPIVTSPVSQSDAAFVREYYGLEHEQAETLSLALRCRMLVTDDRTLETIARARGIEVYDPAGFAVEFSYETVGSDEEPETPDAE